MSQRGLRVGVWTCLAVLGFGAAPVLWAQELPPLTATLSPEEALAAIKRRALAILEERRRARQWRASGEVTHLLGYESNPSNGVEHVGDTYLEQSLYLALSKKLTPTLTWQSSYSGSFDNYLEYGDGDYTSQTVTPAKLLWQPGRMWRLDAGVDLNLTYYPKASASNYREIKPSIGVRQNLKGSWFHAVRYEWYLRDYISKRARDGTPGAETLSDRMDTRHRLRYEVGTTWRQLLCKVKQEWYLQDSNDARQDFYDAEDYKLTASVNRQLTAKASCNASYAFERKNYRHREVAGITAEARYDDTHTWTLAGSYDLNPTWSVNPSLTYKFLDSNEPTGEFVDTTLSASLTARF